MSDLPDLKLIPGQPVEPTPHVWVVIHPSGRRHVMNFEPPPGMGWDGSDVLVLKYAFVEQYVSKRVP